MMAFLAPYQLLFFYYYFSSLVYIFHVLFPFFPPKQLILWMQITNVSETRLVFITNQTANVLFC